MFSLYEKTTFGCSKLVTEQYSTSFTLGIKTLDKKFHNPIFAIYGFVRFADEIVDSFHDFDRKTLLERFRHDTWQAIEEGISLNPVLHSFQKVVSEYHIGYDLIEAFLHSMKMDLHHTSYERDQYNEYIFGSAEVVGLMCLKVFCEGDPGLYEKLSPDARSLGSAFQKVNFLRDIQSDFVERGRVYFPGINFDEFGTDIKKSIEEDIQNDFDKARRGIMGLPAGARSGVQLAYLYYLKLFQKIKNTSAHKIQSTRIRVSDTTKFTLLAKTLVRDSLSVIF